MSQVGERTGAELAVFNETVSWLWDAALDVKLTGKPSGLYLPGDGSALWVLPMPPEDFGPVEFHPQNRDEFDIDEMANLPALIASGDEEDVRAFRDLVTPLFG